MNKLYKIKIKVPHTKKLNGFYLDDHCYHRTFDISMATRIFYSRLGGYNDFPIFQSVYLSDNDYENRLKFTTKSITFNEFKIF